MNYNPWRYGDKEAVRRLRARHFRQDAEAGDAVSRLDAWKVKDDPPESRARVLGEKAAQRVNQMFQWDNPQPAARPKDGGGGKNPFAKALDAAKDFGGDVVKTGLTVLDAPLEYAGAPLFATLSGQTSAARKPILDAQGNETGQFYREKPGWLDPLKSIGSAISDPVGAYQEGREAFRERMANPEQNFLSRAALGAAADPLSYVGPGGAKALVNAARIGGKPGRVARELLDSGGPGIVIGAHVGAQAEADYGEQIPGWNKMSPEARSIIAGVLGGVGGGIARAQIRAKGLDAIPGARQGFGMGTEDVTADPRRAGNQTSVQSSVDPGQIYEFRYRLVDLDDLIVSHDPYTFTPNARYEQEIQPRDRGSAASKTQIEQMARTLDPKKLLAETGDLQNGIPIIGRDGLVESGNGRTMAAMRAAQDFPQRWQSYVNELQGRLMELGIDPTVIGEMRAPFLVRERLTDVDRRAFAAEANNASTLRMGTAETAAADSRLISDELLHNLEIPEGATLDMVLGSPRSAQFVRQFMAQLSPTERGALMDASGNLTAAGLQRLKAAFFAKTFSGDAGQRLLAEFFESTDPSIRNVRNALEQSLASIAQHEAGIRAGRIDGSLSIADDVAAAADAFHRIKSGTLKFKTVDDYLNQASMFGDEMELKPLARDILRFMNENSRAPKQLREALQNFANDAGNLPPPGQAGMFGDVERPSAVTLWEKATGRVVPEGVPEQGGMDLGKERPVFGGGTEQVPPKPKEEPQAPPPEQAPPKSEPEVPPQTPKELDKASRSKTRSRASSARSESPETKSPRTTRNAKSRSGSTARPDESNAAHSSETPNPNAAEQPTSAISALDSEASKGSKAGTEDSVPPRQEQEAPRSEDAPPPPLDRTDDWTILGLKRGQKYTEDELRRAYRAQMRRYHPDINQTLDAHKDAQDINAAFERLMKGQGQTHGTSGTRSGADFREEARRQRRTRDEQQQANEEARARRKQRENPPPGGGDSGPNTYDWWAAWGSKPPEWGEGPPPPPRGPKKPKGPEFKHFDAEERYDLFGAKPRDEQIRRASEYLKTTRGQINQAFRNLIRRLGGEHFDRNLTLDTIVRPFVVGEKNRTSNLINHWTAWVREEAETKMRRAGISVSKAQDGSWRINGDAAMPTIEDVIEKSTPEGRAFYNSLSREQREAIEFIEWANEAVNKTILAHGGSLPFDPDIQGTYFPRKVVGLDGEARTSGSSSFKKSRTMESLEEGLGRMPDDGGKVEYDNPFDAFEAGMRGKLRHAEDAYMAEMLRPLAAKPEDKARAGFGWAYVDHPALQGMLFKQDVADRITAALVPSGENVFSKFPKAVNSVLTPLRATGDLSASFQQGMIAWLKNPKVATDQWLATIASLKDPEHYFKAVDRLERAGPGFNEHIRWGGHYVSPHSVDDFLMPKVAEKLSGGRLKEFPVAGAVARKSNEHFARFLNLVRFEMGNQAWERARALGLEGKALDDHMREAWNGINRASGWSGRRPTTIEQIGAFAPRYLSASVEQLYTALTKGGVEGAIARDHLIRLTVTAGALAFLINSARGHETEFSPTSTNFLRIRDLGGLDVSLLGTYDTLFRNIVQFVAEGDRHETAKRFGWAKLSPTAKLLFESFVEESTFLGKPIDMSSPGGFASAVKESAFSSLPFTIQNLREEGPLAGAIGATGVTSTPVTPTEKRDFARDRLAQERFGQKYDDLPATQKSMINEDPEVRRHQEEADRNTLTRADDRSVYREATLGAQAKIEALSDELESGVIDGEEFRAQYRRIQDELRGARNALKLGGKSDKVIEGWFDLYDLAQFPSGRTDYDKLELLQTEYEKVHPDVQERLEKAIGVNDNQTLRELREARKLASAYYEIPAYLGMTKKQAEHAGRILSQASEMVAFGMARDRNHAFMIMMPHDQEGVMLARRAARAGANPARARFRRDPKNRLFAKFYGPAEF